MHVPFPLKCWDGIAKLRGYNNIRRDKGQRFTVVKYESKAVGIFILLHSMVTRWKPWNSRCCQIKNLTVEKGRGKRKSAEFSKDFLRFLSEIVANMSEDWPFI